MYDPNSEPWITRFDHNFLFSSTDAATLLLLHGTGGNENSLMTLGAELLPGANLLSPRGQVIENGMPRFFRRLSEGVFDEPDLHRRTQELASFVREAVDRGGLKTNSVIAVGYSNGANIAASLLLSQPSLLAGAVLMRAMTPFEPTILHPVPGTPVLLLSGERDPMIPKTNAARLAELLRQSGAQVTHSFAHAGHSLTEPELIVARDFLNKLSSSLN